jgi:hypothetical protein
VLFKCKTSHRTRNNAQHKVTGEWQSQKKGSLQILLAREVFREGLISENVRHELEPMCWTVNGVVQGLGRPASPLTGQARLAFVDKATLSSSKNEKSL